MKYKIEESDGVVVMEIKSSLEGGSDTFQLKDEVKNRLEAGSRKFVLDMSDAGFVNSTGIGILVAILVGVRGVDGALKICRVGERARRAMEVAGVWSLFEIYPTCDDAFRTLRTEVVA